jgi:hypothetical protein
VFDADLDGITDQLDLDSDNDGVSDLVEAGGIDADGDGNVDGFADTDGDGIDDATASAPLPVLDSDGDGIPNSQDTDSDNDGVPDVVESGGVDADGDGEVDSFVDADGDGLDDQVATDNTASPPPPPADSDSDGTPDYLEFAVADSDGDGLPDDVDGDSDNDGIPDVIEGGGVDPGADADSDGIPNYADGDFIGVVNGEVVDFVDSNGELASMTCLTLTWTVSQTSSTSTVTMMECLTWSRLEVSMPTAMATWTGLQTPMAMASTMPLPVLRCPCSTAMATASPTLKTPTRTMTASPTWSSLAVWMPMATARSTRLLMQMAMVWMTRSPLTTLHLLLRLPPTRTVTAPPTTSSLQWPTLTATACPTTWMAIATLNDGIPDVIEGGGVDPGADTDSDHG